MFPCRFLVLPVVFVLNKLPFITGIKVSKQDNITYTFFVFSSTFQCLVLCRNVGFCFNILRMLMLITVPKFAISQSKANSTVLISYDIRSLTLFCYRNAKFWAEFGYGIYLIVPFWYAWAAYQARLVSPWVFWLDCVSPKYEPWLDQTPSRLICHRSVPKRYD